MRTNMAFFIPHSSKKNSKSYYSARYKVLFPIIPATA